VVGKGHLARHGWTARRLRTGWGRSRTNWKPLAMRSKSHQGRPAGDGKHGRAPAEISRYRRRSRRDLLEKSSNTENVLRAPRCPNRMLVGAQVAHPCRLVAHHRDQVELTPRRRRPRWERNAILPRFLTARTSICDRWLGVDCPPQSDASKPIRALPTDSDARRGGGNCPPMKRAHRAPPDTSLPSPGATGFAWLSGRSSTVPAGAE